MRERRSWCWPRANPDKAAEISAILGSVPGLVLRPRPPSVPDVEETGDTLLDNARLKAFSLVEATGMAAVADDTGLEVDALGGAPGVYSARYSGEHATYRGERGQAAGRAGTVTGPRRPSGAEPGSAAWRSSGFPTAARSGPTARCSAPSPPRPTGDGGFGYDPVFVPDGQGGRTFAEMTPEEKHAVSHRGRAFRSLADRLRGA